MVFVFVFFFFFFGGGGGGLGFGVLFGGLGDFGVLGLCSFRGNLGLVFLFGFGAISGLGLFRVSGILWGLNIGFLALKRLGV